MLPRTLDTTPPRLLAQPSSFGVQLAMPWGSERELGGAPTKAKTYRPRKRREDERQVAFTFPTLLPGTSAVVPGVRFGRRLCLLRTGGNALMLCDCGHQGWARARHVAKGQRDACSKCAARERRRPRQIPNTWYVDDIAARRFVLAFDYDAIGAASYEQIAAVWGVSREAVRQVEVRAIVSLAARYGVDEEKLKQALAKVRRPSTLVMEDEGDELDGWAS